MPQDQVHRGEIHRWIRRELHRLLEALCHFTDAEGLAGEFGMEFIVPSGVEFGVILYIERACAISGTSLLTWYALMMLVPQRM